MADAIESIQVPPEIRAVLIPLAGETLLLPNAAVAEVIDYREPLAQPQAPGWLLGSIDWRQRNLPVVQLERMLGCAGGPEKPVRPVGRAGRQRRIMVCHTQGEDAGRPFVGIVADAIPRLVRVRESSLQGLPRGQGDDKLVHARLMVESREALVPDLGELERRVSGLA